MEQPWFRCSGAAGGRDGATTPQLLIWFCNRLCGLGRVRSVRARDPVIPVSPADAGPYNPGQPGRPLVERVLRSPGRKGAVPRQRAGCWNRRTREYGEMGKETMRKMGKTLTAIQILMGCTLVCAALTPVLAGQEKPAPGKPPAGPWMNKALPPDQRETLVQKQLTLNEKIQLVHGLSTYSLPGLPGYKRSPGSLEGDGFVPAIPRLGLPALQIIGAGVGVTTWGGDGTASQRCCPHRLRRRLRGTRAWPTRSGR